MSCLVLSLSLSLWVRYTAEALEQFDSQLSEVVVPDTDWETGPARDHLERDLHAAVHAARCGGEKGFWRWQCSRAVSEVTLQRVEDKRAKKRARLAAQAPQFVPRGASCA